MNENFCLNFFLQQTQILIFDFLSSFAIKKIAMGRSDNEDLKYYKRSQLELEYTFTRNNQVASSKKFVLSLVHAWHCWRIYAMRSPQSAHAGGVNKCQIYLQNKCFQIQTKGENGKVLILNKLTCQQFSIWLYSILGDLVCGLRAHSNNLLS